MLARTTTFGQMKREQISYLNASAKSIPDLTFFRTPFDSRQERPICDVRLHAKQREAPQEQRQSLDPFVGAVLLASSSVIVAANIPAQDGVVQHFEVPPSRQSSRR